MFELGPARWRDRSPDATGGWAPLATGAPPSESASPGTATGAQSLEQQGRTTPLTRPRHRQLRGPAAVVALKAWDIGMQPGFELKEIHLTPAVSHAVVNQPVLGPTRRTRGTTTGVLDFKIDPLPVRVELDLGGMPRGLQAKRGFDLVVHRAHGRRQHLVAAPPTVMSAEK